MCKHIRYYLILTSIWAAAAASNAIATEESFMPEPKVRGTIGLFWNCAFAFGICVWTAIHTDLNPSPFMLDRIAYKLGWVVLAALAPEIIIYIALMQYLQAKELRDAWNEKYPDTFGLQGGFMVLMGGFVVEPELNDKFVTTLKPAGFRKLMGLDDVKNRRKEERDVNDKGKTDGISKFIVSLQALWMVVQYFGRKHAGLPATILEFHVVIQILYSVATYGFW
ncbi:hypothetical protein BDD12DRAFT_754670, partial [Trichophaea hybrida]